MITHYFTLLALSKEFESVLQNFSVQEAYSQHKNQLWITFGDPSNRHEEYSLCLSVDPKFNYCFLKDGYARAKKNSVDLFPGIVGMTVQRVSAVPYERVLQFSFSKNLSLVAKLYNTAESNVFLVRDDRSIIEAFKNNRTLHGTTYQPDEHRFDTRLLTERELFESHLRADMSQSTLTALKRTLPMLGSVFAKEVLCAASIDEKSGIAQLSSDEIFKILRCVQKLISTVDNAMPGIYTRQSGTRVFSVIPLSHLSGCTHESSSTINNGIRSFVQYTLHSEDFETVKKQLGEKLSADLLRLQRSIQQMSLELNNVERDSLYERNGRLLMANLHRIARGVTEIEVENFLEDNSLVQIALEPGLAPAQNAARYFDKAKKSKGARAELKRKCAQAEKKLSTINGLLEKLDQCTSNDDLKKFRISHEKELSSMRLFSKKEEDDLPPFRIFTVVGGFEVWVGKNSANNDLLTMKYAKPNDLWFHARGASGSHTLLRVHGATLPSKEAIHQAASIAAYYSKMRNAGNVPVAYCERKYVRKPKGSHTGTVVLEREKVIFVQPRLPQT
jgi:predicted ribosome quality control (RQC) complex YloA/Tae2 family protein